MGAEGKDIFLGQLDQEHLGLKRLIMYMSPKMSDESHTGDDDDIKFTLKVKKRHSKGFRTMQSQPKKSDTLKTAIAQARQNYKNERQNSVLKNLSVPCNRLKIFY